jgi:4'-phosphopantetheinyl transferase
MPQSRIPARVSAGEVHVWSANLSNPDVTAREHVLSCDERIRAKMIRCPERRRRCIAARVFVRSVLACYTATDPAAIVFSVSQNGKPVLSSSPEPQFNLSHSHDLAVCAVATRPVGVDVERIRLIPNIPDIIKRYCGAEEAEQLRSREERCIETWFLAGWTQKEAYLKATGQGLSALTLAPRVSWETERAPTIPRNADGDGRWTVINVECGSDYVGALVLNGEIRRVIYRSLN